MNIRSILFTVAGSLAAFFGVVMLLGATGVIGSNQFIVHVGAFLAGSAAVLFVIGMMSARKHDTRMDEELRKLLDDAKKDTPN